MSDVLPLTPPVGREPEVPGVVSAVAVAARGNSVVLAAPPSPSYAGAVIGAAVARADTTPTNPVILLVPEASLEAWAHTATIAAASVGKTAALGSFPSRAEHHLASGRIDVLVTTASVASVLLGRSALPVDRLSAVIVAWPEFEVSEESFVSLFADLPKECQRIVVTTDPTRAAAFIERHAWRAPVLGPLATAGDKPVTSRCRVAAVGWDGRLSALGAAADLLDVDTLSVWTVEPSPHDSIIARLAAHGVEGRPTTDSFPEDDAVVFFDAPPPDVLAQAAAARSIVLLPPGVERYLGELAGRLEPVNLPGALDHADLAIQSDRRAIRTAIEAGVDRAAYATVAPLLDRFSAAEVAVALQALWQRERSRPRPAPTSAVRPPASRPTTRPAGGPKVWLSLGKKDGASLGDVMALLNIDAGVARSDLGRVDLKESFTLIEFGTEEAAKRALEKLQGAEVKGRRLAARIDRGPKRPT